MFNKKLLVVAMAAVGLTACNSDSSSTAPAQSRVLTINMSTFNIGETPMTADDECLIIHEDNRGNLHRSNQCDYTIHVEHAGGYEKYEVANLDGFELRSPVYGAGSVTVKKASDLATEQDAYTFSAKQTFSAADNRVQISAVNELHAYITVDKYQVQSATLNGVPMEDTGVYFAAYSTANSPNEAFNAKVEVVLDSGTSHSVEGLIMPTRHYAIHMDEGQSGSITIETPDWGDAVPVGGVLPYSNIKHVEGLRINAATGEMYGMSALPKNLFGGKVVSSAFIKQPAGMTVNDIQSMNIDVDFSAAQHYVNIYLKSEGGKNLRADYYPVTDIFRVGAASPYTLEDFKANYGSYTLRTDFRESFALGDTVVGGNFFWRMGDSTNAATGHFSIHGYSVNYSE